jgi:hypothetical protein
MPLIASVLQTGFQTLFESNSISSQAAADALAKTYATYAQAGTFGASVPVFTGLEQKALSATLLASFSSPQTQNPALWGTAWAAGLANFWLAPPIVVSGAQAGLVTVALGIPLLAAALPPTIVPQQSAASAAATLAAILHTATLTVIATVAPPPGTQLTIL